MLTKRGARIDMSCRLDACNSVPGQMRVSQGHQTMSATAAAFPESGRRMRATVAPPTTVNRVCYWWRNLLQQHRPIAEIEIAEERA